MLDSGYAVVQHRQGYEGSQINVHTDYTMRGFFAFALALDSREMSLLVLHFIRLYFCPALRPGGTSMYSTFVNSHFSVHHTVMCVYGRGRFIVLYFGIEDRH